MSKSQPASARDGDDDLHESVTIAPPAPNLEDVLRQPTPLPAFSLHGEPHLRSAIEAGARAGSTLSELSKMAEELSNGVVGAKRANEMLVQELSTLRAMLSSASEQRSTLQERLAELTQELMQVRAEADRERQFLSSQHDDFIAALIEEHEEELSAQAGESQTRRLDAGAGDLSRKLVQTETARLRAEADAQTAREALRLAERERELSQVRAEKRERERDELRAEASLLRARLGTSRTASTAPPPALTPRPPSYHPPAALQLDAGELDSTLHGRPPVPRRVTPPPRSERSQSASEFPRVSTRPGVGGPKPSQPPPPAPSFGPPPTSWTPPPPRPVEPAVTAAPPRARVISAASLPPTPSPAPVLRQKPDPATRPLISYALGEDGVESETLEGARLSSKPPRK